MFYLIVTVQVIVAFDFKIRQYNIEIERVRPYCTREFERYTVATTKHLRLN